MQQLTMGLEVSDPFLKIACDRLNRNNPDGAVAEIRPVLIYDPHRKNKIPGAAVFIVNGMYKGTTNFIGTTRFHKKNS